VRAIVKRPNSAPVEQDIRLEDLPKIVEGSPGRCISGPGVHVYCNDDGLGTGLPLNVVRPSDGSPIMGTIVAIGVDGPYERGLTERECALWLATLALIGVDPFVGLDDTKTWRVAAMRDLAPRIHDQDRKMYSKLVELVER